jgi:2,4-dienoyl-CoA reductase-like NADH-dependent reductase (Old Yellow Enzyme family)/thioredoxin reductase
MNPIKTLIGRRQFLIATGVASTCALTCKKLAGFQMDTAMAAEKASSAVTKEAVNKYPHLLSPFRIRNVVLKNRIMHTQSPPHSMQGPENYPTEVYRNHYSNMAKNAAIVSLSMAYGSYPQMYNSNTMMVGPQHYSDSIWQKIPPVENYIRRLIDDVHCEGTLVSSNVMGGGNGVGSGGGGIPGGAMPQGQGSGQGGATPGGAGSQGGMPGGAGVPGNVQGSASGQGGMPGGAAPSGGAMPSGGGTPGGMPGQRQSTVSIKDLVAQVKEAEDMGIDVMSVSGNSVEQVQAIRNATNLILLAKLNVGGGLTDGTKGAGKKWRWNYSGAEFDWQFSKKVPGVDNTHCPSADEIEQAVEAAKKIEGMADILWIRDGRSEHPNSFIQNKNKPFSLYYAEAIKKAGVKILVCPSAGFHDVAQNEEFIAGGLTDMVGMATPFFADAEYVKKALEGRADDIVPCLQCHSCHGISRTEGPWYDTCTVNPKWATPDYKLKNIPAPTKTKKVAVIGGGPGGMKAALVAAERGHKVTLYEKGDSMGGLLQFSDYSQWRWNHKDFKDYLIHQVKKSGIEVQLKTTATPEMIKSKGYDTILVSTGAEPVISRMPGADAKNVFNILTAYSNKKDLGKNVVMIGAGRIGTELAIGMAKDGHKVTQICADKDLIELEFIGAHNMMNQILILQNHPDYDCILEATVKSITDGKVTYTDSNGNEKSIQADSLVIYSGLKPRMDEAEKFLGSANQVLLLGDCTGKSGTIQKTIRSAFFMASQV